MSTNPHRYVLQKRVRLADFVEAVRFIRQCGAMEDFQAKPLRGLDIDGHKYWIMNAALEATISINRKRLSSTA
jgi:hypothetical protein